MPPEEFTQRTPSTALGASLSVIAPTGEYVPYYLISAGTNRRSFKREIGLSQPWGNWFAEVSTRIWFNTDNRNFLGNNMRSLSIYAGYVSGGRTAINGVPDEDHQANTRYGVTFSAPIARGWSARLALSNGFITRAGGNYKSVACTLQYRWFDH